MKKFKKKYYWSEDSMNRGIIFLSKLGWNIYSSKIGFKRHRRTYIVIYVRDTVSLDKLELD